MKNWSLRLKLTAWSALLTGLVILLCGLGTGFYCVREQIEALDDQMADEAHTFFVEVARRGGKVDWHNRKDVELILPTARTKRYAQIRDQDGLVLFQTGRFPVDSSGRTAPHTIKFRGQTVRLGDFQEDGMTLRLGIALNEINEDVADLRLILVITLPFFVGLIALGGWFLSRKALAPIRQLTAGVEKITAQQLSTRLPLLPGNDEVARLSAVLNETFDRLDASFQQAARFTADASHELKTPIAVMRAGIENLLESHTLPQAERAEVSALLEQTRRLSEIFERLLLLSRADSGHLRLDRRHCDLTGIVSACAEDATIFAEDREIEIVLTLPPQLPAFVDPPRVSQLLLNLLVNAVKYNRDAGVVRIEASLENGSPTIRIWNTGPGIPPAAKEMLFERFFRAAPKGGIAGHGLGLSLVRELARAHDGEVTLERADEQWTVFCVRLGPAQTGQAPTPPRQRASETQDDGEDYDQPEQDSPEIETALIGHGDRKDVA